MPDKNPWTSVQERLPLLIAAGAFVAGMFGVGGHIVGGSKPAELELIVKTAVGEAMATTSEERLSNFTHRVDDDHEDCIVDALKQDETTDQLLSRIICDLSRAHEYSRRSVR